MMVLKSVLSPAMNTEGNKMIVRRFVDAVNHQNWDLFDQLVAAEFSRHSSTFGQENVRTRDQLRQYLTAEFTTFPDARETINSMVAEDDKVVVHSHCYATQRAPMGSFPTRGRTLSADFISIYRIANDQIVEAWAEWDALNGLIQLGHLEPPRL
jgi:steroid delta-isomerase-like uncharacterized protein